MNPDWVIFGVSDSDGVVLYASSSLSAIELEAQYQIDFPNSWYWCESWDAPRLSHVDLTVTMHQYVIVRAETYADALCRLMNMHGEPDAWHRQAPEIEVQKELPEGRDHG